LAFADFSFSPYFQGEMSRSDRGVEPSTLKYEFDAIWHFLLAFDSYAKALEK
jgi:hypothetical protein